MRRTIILVTGCQRSGTTLMHLILDSHPDIQGIDESRFEYEWINTYINASWFPDCISLKLPRYAPLFSFIKSLPDYRVLWCIRNPLDTILSMMNLKLPWKTEGELSWVAHPACAHAEIINCYWSLSDALKHELAPLMDEYQAISLTPPATRTQRELVFSAALCWRIKNELPSCYVNESIRFHTVKYESLVSKPEEEVLAILDHAGLDWHDDVMRHNELHDGVSIGKTVNTRPIDNKGVGRGKSVFSPTDVELIKKICGGVPNRYGYQLGA